MSIKEILFKIDYFLFLLLFSIFGVGIVSIASSTDFMTFGITRELKLQVIALVLGLMVSFIMIFINYEIYGYLYWGFYAMSIIFLLMVYIPGLGVEQFGARSWIKLGPVFFQTSELSKLAYIIFLSKFLEKMGGVRNILNLIKAGITILPICGLLLKQPDLGTTLVFLIILVVMLYVNQIRMWIVALGLGAIAVLSPIAYKYMKPHQKIRIDAFLNPDDLSLPGNYHVYQSKITLGSGGIYGRGVLNGIYHKLNFLPVKESDFIFPVFVEETGFIGGALLIGMYFIFISRLLYDSTRASSVFGSNIIVGIIAMFAFQIIENIGMTMGVMPVTGLTLPFVSYGATSVLINTLAIGLVQQIYVRRIGKAR